MKSFLKTAIIVLLVLCLSIALFACKEDEPSNENNAGDTGITDNGANGGTEDTNQGTNTGTNQGTNTGDTQSEVNVSGNRFSFEPNAEKNGYVLSSATLTTGEVTIPSVYDEKPVTEIGEKAFYSNATLTKVTVPSSVTVIGDRAFSLCINLAEVNVASVSSLTKIGNRAFYQCDRLETVTLPEGLKEVGTEAFNGCLELKTLAFPSSLEKIGAYAFHTGWFESLSDGLITISNVAYSYKITANDAAAEQLIIPETVTAVAEKAFYGNEYIASLSIPQSVSYIGDKAFANMPSLTDIEVSANNENYSSEGNCLIETGAKKLLVATAKSDIHEWIEIIGSEAYAFRRDISAVTLPEGLKAIEANAFEGSSVTTVEIPEGVTVIEQRVFLDCDKLESIRILSGITEIKSAAFNGCTSLKEITIDSDVILEKCIGKLNSVAGLMAYAEIVYVNEELESISPYLVASFSVVKSDKDGYIKYVINK